MNKMIDTKYSSNIDETAPGSIEGVVQPVAGTGGAGTSVRESRDELKDLLKKLDIDSAEFQARQEFLGFTEKDGKLLLSLRPMIEKNAVWVVDRFYENIERHPQLKEVIARAGSNVERLKVTQRKYLLELFCGDYGSDYVESRLRIGVIHFKIGLGPLWYLGSYSVYMSLLSQLLDRNMPFQPRRRRQAKNAINKILSLDSQIAIDSYILSMTGMIRSTVAKMEGGIAAQMELVNEQVGAIAQTRSSLRDISGQSSKTLDMAKSWMERTEESVDVGITGLGMVKKAVDAISEVQVQMHQMATTIGRLSQQAMRIAGITDTVESLARQSKMLAINASIEAAHAGEAGQGFSVVASEVASLAEQSAQATLQVREVLAEIETAAERAASVTEEGTRKMNEGTRLIEAAGEAVDTLFGAIKETSEASDQISRSVMSQATGIGQIGAAMEDLNMVAAGLKGRSDDVQGSLDELTANLDKQLVLAGSKAIRLG